MRENASVMENCIALQKIVGFLTRYNSATKHPLAHFRNKTVTKHVRFSVLQTKLDTVYLTTIYIDDKT